MNINQQNKTINYIIAQMDRKRKAIFGNAPILIFLDELVIWDETFNNAFAKAVRLHGKEAKSMFEGWDICRMDFSKLKR